MTLFVSQNKKTNKQSPIFTFYHNNNVHVYRSKENS